MFNVAVAGESSILSTRRRRMRRSLLVHEPELSIPPKSMKQVSTVVSSDTGAAD